MAQSGLAELLDSRMAARGGSQQAEQKTPGSDVEVEAPNDAEPAEELPPEVAAEESDPTVEAQQDSDSDADASNDDDADEKSDTDEQSSPDMYDVESFAAAVGWEPADLYNSLEVPIKQPDGTFAKAKLGAIKDALEGWQDQVVTLQRAQAEFAEKVQQFQAQSQQHSTISDAEKSAQDAIAQIQASYNSQDWDKLAEEDPGKAAYMRQRYGIAFEEAKSALDQAKTQADQERHTMRQQAIQQHNQVLAHLVPEWRDPAVYQQEAPEVERFATQILGFRPEELGTIIDGRARAAARLAWIGWKHMQEVNAGTQRIRQAPKPVLKPGTGQQRKDPVEREIKTLRERAKTSNRREDKIALGAAVLQRGMARQRDAQAKATRRKR